MEDLPLPVGVDLECSGCHTQFTVRPDHPGAELGVAFDSVTIDGPPGSGSAMSHSVPVPAWYIPCPKCGRKKCSADTDFLWRSDG